MSAALASRAGRRRGPWLSRRRLLLIGVGACLIWAARVSPELLCAGDAGASVFPWACNRLPGSASSRPALGPLSNDRQLEGDAPSRDAPVIRSLRGSEPHGALASVRSPEQEPRRKGHASDSSSHGGPAQFDPRDLRFLQALIDRNGLTEASSSFDRDDGDGVLGPLEVGTQVWRDGRLVEFRSGPDPYGSYGYRIHTLPEQIADVGALEVLDLNSNQLTELPEALGQLHNLRELRLFGNQLSELPASLSGLRSLRILMLSGNRLSELPESIGELDALEELYLRDDPLTTLPAGIVGLAHLRVLDVTHPTTPRALGTERAARRVAAIAAADPRFTALPEELASLPRLQALYLAGNRLDCTQGGESPDLLPAFLRDGSIRYAYGLQLQECP